MFCLMSQFYGIIYRRMGDSKASEIHKVLKEIYRQSYYARVSSSLLSAFCIFLECQMWGGACCGSLGTSWVSWPIALSPWDNLKRRTSWMSQPGIIDAFSQDVNDHVSFRKKRQHSHQKIFITDIGKKNLLSYPLEIIIIFSLFWSSYSHFCDIITKTYWCFLSFGN